MIVVKVLVSDAVPLFLLCSVVHSSVKGVWYKRVKGDNWGHTAAPDGDGKHRSLGQASRGGQCGLSSIKGRAADRILDCIRPKTRAARQ